MQETIDRLEKLEKVAELQANLLLRLVPSLCEEDQMEVLIVQEKAQAVLSNKIKPHNPLRHKRRISTDRSTGRRVTRSRGKERDREDY